MKLVFVALLACVAAAWAAPPCEDVMPMCGFYKRSGHCTSRKEFMQKACAKTCGLCGQISTLPPRVLTFAPKGQCGRSQVQQSRIVNGDAAKEGAWPWIASLGFSGRHFCGGSLIHPNWVLTAAHCVGVIIKNGVQGVTVKLGAHDFTKHNKWQQEIKLKRVVEHENYLRAGLHNDFALLELAHPAQLNSRVELACLPTQGVAPAIGRTDCYHAGWGMTNYPGRRATKLNQAMLPVVKVDHCQHNREAICAGFGDEQKANACRGDSGGPFMCRQKDGRWELVGVASYVVTYCKYYTGFSPINQQVAWIQKTINA